MKLYNIVKCPLQSTAVHRRQISNKQIFDGLVFISSIYSTFTYASFEKSSSDNYIERSATASLEYFAAEFVIITNWKYLSLDKTTLQYHFSSELIRYFDTVTFKKQDFFVTSGRTFCLQVALFFFS